MSETNLSGDTREVVKLSVIFFLFTALLLITAGLIHYYTILYVDLKSTKSNELLNVELGKIAIEQSLQGVVSDLMYLAKHNEENIVFAANNRKQLKSMANDFQIFSQQKRVYDQIRYIDKTGMEVIRVNHINGKAVIVPQGELQNKLGRYYFSNSMALNPGQIYISKFDLNIEQGETEQPQKPVLRFATPVQDLNGEKQGILIFNYRGEYLLNNFLTAVRNTVDHTMLLNTEGYWLSNPDPVMEWGFMYGNTETFASKYPDVWQYIQTHNSGQYSGPDGLFTFASVYPLLNGHNKPGNHTDVLQKAPQFYWKIVSHLSDAGMAVIPRFKQYLPLYAFMLVLLFIGSILLAQARVRHHKTFAQLQFEQRFRETLENIQLLAFGLDNNGKITFCNNALLSLTGWHEQEITGRDWFELFIPEVDRENSKLQFQDIISETIVVPGYENKILTRQGEKCLVSWNISLMYDPQGQTCGLHCIGQDITDSRRTEEELHNVLQAVEQSPSTVMITGVDGLIEYVNPKFTQLTGYTLDEVRGRNPRFLKTGETDASEYQQLWEYITNGEEWHGVFHNRKKNGDLYWESACISPIRNAEGKIIHYLAVKEDITERKRLEEEVEESNREIVRNQALAVTGRMASMIAHDLRNPLSSIKMGLQILGSKDSRDWNEDEQELKQIALGQIAYMEEIMEDLLSYSRPDALKPEWLRLDQLLDTVLIQVQKQINDYHANIVRQFQPGLPNLHGDARKLRQVFTNIIVNGLQATEGLTDRRPEIIISLSQEFGVDKPKLRIEIIDNGHGIAPDYNDKILEPFFTTRAKGTGLGLAIVNRIVDQHHGTLEFRQYDASGGTTVIIILPTGPVDFVFQAESSRNTSNGEMLQTVK